MYPEKPSTSDELTVATVSTCADRSGDFSTQEFVAKKVRFSHETEVQNVLHIHDMEETDIQNIWYQKADYVRVKKEIIPIARRFMGGERIVESNRETIRGLENSARLQVNKKLSFLAVFNEQTKQQALRRPNAESIAAAYGSFCTESGKVARLLGSQDEEFVMKDLIKIRRRYAKFSSEATKPRVPMSLKDFLRNLPRTRTSYGRAASVSSLTVGC